jgi:hypothetical protein
VQVKAWRFSDFSSVIGIQYGIPCFEVQKGAIEDDLEFYPYCRSLFQLQVLEEEHAKEFRECSLLGSANGGLQQDLIAVVLLSSP